MSGNPKKHSTNSNKQPDPKRRQLLISKALSKLLRHQAVKEGLGIDSQGFVKLQEVLSHKFLKSLKATPEEVFSIVDTNDKKRFKIILRTPENTSEDQIEVTKYDSKNSPEYFICALQGHSLANVTDSYELVELKTPNDFPKEIIHGTDRQSWKLIKDSNGLSKMRRNHIHFAAGLPEWLIERRQMKNTGGGDSSEVDDKKFEQEKVISGMRKSSKVLIYLDVEKVVNSDELRFYRSGNGVILTPGNHDGFVTRKYFLKVTDMMGTLID